MASFRIAGAVERRVSPAPTSSPRAGMIPPWTRRRGKRFGAASSRVFPAQCCLGARTSGARALRAHRYHSEVPRMNRQNLFTGAWDGESEEGGTRQRIFWRPGDARMGATLYELAPDAAEMKMHMH